jgi:hypothetical protein
MADLLGTIVGVGATVVLPLAAVAIAGTVAWLYGRDMLRPDRAVNRALRASDAAAARGDVAPKSRSAVSLDMITGALDFPGFGRAASAEGVAPDALPPEPPPFGAQAEAPADAVSFLDAYHRQSIAQARAAFAFSLVFAGLGAVFIAVALAYATQPDLRGETTGDATGALARAIVPLVSGTIIEAVSVLIISQSNKARTLMTESFDKARRDRACHQAIEVARTIPDQALASRTQAVLALRLAETKTDSATLARILEGPPPAA